MRNSIWNVSKFFSLLLLIVGLDSVQAQENQAGDIVLVKGEVLIMNSKSQVVADPEGKRGRSTKVGQPFFVGERIVTKATGRIKLKFKEGGNEVVLGADTSLLIERAGTSAANKGTSLNLAKGEVRASVNPDLKYSGSGKDVFEVKTPNAVAGVRGTVFMTRFRGQSTEVATERGAVFVGAPGRPSSEGVMVRRGLFTALGGNGGGARPSAPRPIAENPKLMNTLQDLAGAGGGGQESSSSSNSDLPGSENGAGEKSTNSESPSSSSDAKNAGGPSSGASTSDSGSASSGESSVALDAPLSREPVSSETAARSPASAPTGGGPQPLSGTPTLMGEAPAGGEGGGPVVAPIVAPVTRLPVTTIPRTVQDAITSRSNDSVFQNTKGQVNIVIPRP